MKYAFALTLIALLVALASLPLILCLGGASLRSQEGRVRRGREIL